MLSGQLAGAEWSSYLQAEAIERANRGATTSETNHG
jgi:hypothetical protein